MKTIIVLGILMLTASVRPDKGRPAECLDSIFGCWKDCELSRCPAGFNSLGYGNACQCYRAYSESELADMNQGLCADLANDCLFKPTESASCSKAYAECSDKKTLCKLSKSLNIREIISLCQ